MVNTQTSISKKVLAVILAVACMVCFTPSIAFTQDAHATGGGEITTSSSQTEVIGYFGGTDAVDSVTVSGNTYTVIMKADTTLTSAISVGDGVTVNVDLYGHAITGAADKDVFQVCKTGNLNLTSTVAGGAVSTSHASPSTAAVSAIDGAVANETATTGTITVDKNVTVSAVSSFTTGSPSTTTYDSAITVSKTAFTGKIVVNGTLTGTASQPVMTDVSAATVSGTGSITAGTVTSTTAKWSAGRTASIAINTSNGSSQDTSITSVTSTIPVGDVLVATVSPTTANTTTGYTYTWYAADKAGATNGTQVGTGQKYEVTAANAGKYIYVVATDGTYPGTTAAEASYTTTALKVAAALSDAKIAVTSGTATEQAATVGTAFSLDMTATTTPATVASPTYKWYVNTAKSTTGATEIKATTQFGGAYYTGIGTSNLKLTSATATATEANTYYYYCVVTSGGVSKTSNFYTLEVSTKGIVAKSQPKSFTSAIGETNDASAATKYTDAQTYFQVKGITSSATFNWYYTKTGTADPKTDTKLTSGNVISNTGVTPTFKTFTSGSINDISAFSVSTASTATAGDYKFYCVANDGSTQLISDVITVSVAKAGITTSPKSKTYLVGDDAVQMKVATNSNNAGNPTWYASTAAITPSADAINTAINAGTLTQITSNNYKTYFTSDSTFNAAAVTPLTTTAGTTYFFAAYTIGTTTYYTEVAKIEVKVAPAAKGTTFTSGAAKYKITTAATTSANGKVQVTAPAKNSSTKVTIPSTVTYKSYTYSVTGIASKAFAKSKCKTLTIKSKSLTKAGVKNSLKGSKVTTVKVPSSKVKTYKTYFTKANCGKKVTVKKY